MDRGLSEADGAGLAGRQPHPEPGPCVPAHAWPAASRPHRP